MRFIGETENGSFVLKNVVSVEINRELGVPADDMTIKLADYDIPELRRVYAVDDGYDSTQSARKNNALRFVGLVDEQITTITPNGSKVVVCTRSPAAAVLDSECESRQYVDPSARIMFAKHLERFGITAGNIDNSFISGILNIASGQSHYAAVKSFCTTFLNTVPRIDSIGVFSTNAEKEDDAVLFSNESGIPFIRAAIKNRRCSRVSRVFAVSERSAAEICDDDAVSRDIVRERRLNLLDSRTGTLSDANEIIEKGILESFSAELTCPCDTGDIIGRSAVCTAAGLKSKALTVKRTKYTADASGEKTIVELVQRKQALM